MWAIFQESGNSPVVMHLLKNLDNHSDTMQLAIFKILDGMSLGELLDFILRFLMRSLTYLQSNAKYRPKLFLWTSDKYSWPPWP